VLSSLTSLRLEYDCPYEGDISPAAHAAPLLAAASGVVELSIEGMCWVEEEDGVVQVPDLSPCTALTRLWACAGEHDREIAAQDVLLMVRPLGRTLRVLTLGYKRVSPQAAAALQDMLPHLEHVLFYRCRKMCEEDPTAGSEEEQLARLRQQLRHGLKLSVS
jgi:hypothetical protein